MNRTIAARKAVTKSGGSRSTVITLETLLRRKQHLTDLAAAISAVYPSDRETSFGRLLELLTMEIAVEFDKL